MWSGVWRIWASLTFKSNLGSTRRWIVVMNNIPVSIARTERELASTTLARDVRLFMFASREEWWVGFRCYSWAFSFYRSAYGIIARRKWNTWALLKVVIKKLLFKYRLLILYKQNPKHNIITITCCNILLTVHHYQIHLKSLISTNWKFWRYKNKIH